MDPYFLFLKTVVSTLFSLMGAAAVLFTTGPGPDVDTPRRSPVVLASMALESGMLARCDESSPATAQQGGDDKSRALVVDALVGALKDPDAGVRRHAVTALGEIGDSRAVKGLIAALADEDRQVRRAAATALGELGDASALEPLTRAMKDEDPEVRRRAIIAVSELSEERGSAIRRRRGPGTPTPTPTPTPSPNPRPRPVGAES